MYKNIYKINFIKTFPIIFPSIATIISLYVIKMETLPSLIPIVGSLFISLLILASNKEADDSELIKIIKQPNLSNIKPNEYKNISFKINRISLSELSLEILGNTKYELDAEPFLIPCSDSNTLTTTINNKIHTITIPFNIDYKFISKTKDEIACINIEKILKELKQCKTRQSLTEKAKEIKSILITEMEHVKSIYIEQYIPDNLIV